MKSEPAETIEDRIADRIAERLDLRTLEDRIVRRVVAEIRAADNVEWVPPAQWSRANGCSDDTTARKIARGELEVKELGRTPLRGKDGQQLLDRDGRPRFRRTLRVKLTRPITAAEVRVLAAEIRT